MTAVAYMLAGVGLIAASYWWGPVAGIVGVLFVVIGWMLSRAEREGGLP